MVGGCWLVSVFLEVEKWGPKTVKNGPRVWAFCKIEFPGIQKPVQILTQKSGFFKNPGNRGVGVIWLVRGGLWSLSGYLVVVLVWCDADFYYFILMCGWGGVVVGFVYSFFGVLQVFWWEMCFDLAG